MRDPVDVKEFQAWREQQRKAFQQEHARWEEQRTLHEQDPTKELPYELQPPDLSIRAYRDSLSKDWR